jgi:hypothetical protein
MFPNVTTVYTVTVKLVLRDYIWDKEKWPYKTGDFLKEGQFIWNLLWQNKKRWLLNRDDHMVCQGNFLFQNVKKEVKKKSLKNLWLKNPFLVYCL